MSWFQTLTPHKFVFYHLFILYTGNCRSQKEDSLLVKFCDDTAPLTLLQGSEIDHGRSQPDFNW